MIIYEHYSCKLIGEAMIEPFKTAMGLAVDELLRTPVETIEVFHHNDTDGLSSGTILEQALTGISYQVKRYALEKPYPQVLEKIFSESGKVLIFTDFAGRIAPLIAELNGGRNLVLILDHHPAVDTDDSSVYVLDGELYGVKGDRDISASATCYLFASILLERKGERAAYLSHLGVLGALGDGFLVDGALSGYNAEVFAVAEREGLMRSETDQDPVSYYITLGAVEYPAPRVCSLLDTVGGVGYYSGGPDLGVRICREGLDAEAEAAAAELLEKQDQIFEDEKRRLSHELITTGHLQWFDVKDRFQPMGVKMIGVFCTQIKDSDLVDVDKYLAGFQYIPDRVPGFGPIDFGSTKISMRVSQRLTAEIRSGNMPPLNEVLPDATKRLDGFVDACHGLSAATTVLKGQEERLIEEIEQIFSERMV